MGHVIWLGEKALDEIGRPGNVVVVVVQERVPVELGFWRQGDIRWHLDWEHLYVRGQRGDLGRALDGQLQSVLECVYIAAKSLGNLLHLCFHSSPVCVCPGSWYITSFIVRMVGDSPLYSGHLGTLDVLEDVRPGPSPLRHLALHGSSAPVEFVDSISLVVVVGAQGPAVPLCFKLRLEVDRGIWVFEEHQGRFNIRVILASDFWQQ